MDKGVPALTYFESTMLENENWGQNAMTQF